MNEMPKMGLLAVTVLLGGFAYGDDIALSLDGATNPSLPRARPLSAAIRWSDGRVFVLNFRSEKSSTPSSRIFGSTLNTNGLSVAP
jgi:hypothetical protein